MDLHFLLTMGLPAIICLILGIVLLTIEMFTPGFAIPGISGIILLLISVVLTAKNFMQALIMILIILAVLTVIMIIAMKSATNGALSRSRLVLHNREESSQGFLSADDMEYLIGKKGVAITTLRPAGSADFDGVRLDVVTEGDYVEKGQRVFVCSVEGRRVVVRPTKGMVNDPENPEK